MAIQALGNIGPLYRYQSENNQVYGFRDSDGKRWIIKIAGKEEYQRQGLITEIQCLRQLKSLGLPVADIHCTHEDIRDAFQPFFIIPYLGKSKGYWERKPQMLAHIMRETGRFIKLLSEIKGDSFSGGILMDRNTTLDYFHAECRDNTAYLKGNGLWDCSVEKCLAWTANIYSHTEPCVGQSQASEPLIDHSWNIQFVDFEGGLNYTYPIKSLECITHYIEGEREYDTAKKELISGFYGEDHEISSNLYDEWVHWRQYKALTDLVFLSATRNDPRIFRDNWSRYNL